MTYSVRIFHSEEVSSQEREDAARRFCVALETSLGDASLVAPAYLAYQRLLQRFGEQARPWALAADEQLLADQWEAAELAAIQAAFGTERYMGDADFELRLSGP